MNKRAATNSLYIAASEARYWAGTSRAKSTDAEVIAAVEAGPKSREFKAMVKRIQKNR